MEDALTAPAESSPSSPSSEVPEVLRWACEHFAQQWEWETDRRRSLDAKAAQIIGAVAAVLLWSISEIGKLPQPGWGQVFMGIAAVVQAVGAIVAGFCAFRCVRIGTVRYPNFEELKSTTSKGAEMTERQTLVHYRNHMEFALMEARKVSEDKATMIRPAESAAIFAVPAGIVLAILAKLISL